MRRRLLVVVLLVSGLGGGAFAYKWQVSETYHESKVSFSEVYMFGSDDFFPEKWWPSRRSSRIRANLEVVPPSDIAVVLVSKSIGLGHVHACANASRVSKIRRVFDVRSSGFHSLAIEVCGRSSTPVRFEGTVVFRNPTGYLPAPEFGNLPFQAARLAVVCVALIVHVCRSLDKKKRKPAHLLITLALGLAAADAAAWVATYFTINSSGRPLCCPFGLAAVVSMASRLASDAFARVLVLCAAQGVGTDVGMRTGRATAMIVLWTSAYVSVGAMAVAAAVDSGTRESTNYFRPKPARLLLWQIPAALLEAIFLVWLHKVCPGTIHFLRQTGQTAEAAKCRRLRRVFFVGIFLAATYSAAVLALRPLWPYPWKWAQDVQQDLFSLLLLLCVAVEWRPRFDDDDGRRRHDLVVGAADDEWGADDFDEHDDDDDDGMLPRQDDDLEDVPPDGSNRRGAAPTKQKGQYQGLTTQDEQDDDDDIETPPQKRD
ncbi:hypothetical protein CTAYLR_005804 [Chrysophaeum taylorii]|uniref:GOST seven transmembrane domain-containing protein n=1 Tax=Chrysophaeum taylorii TaxID=2483200 RepID=A0AAD7ULV1_9STRA|nr:hypothetical protein CTAYLR_005804 [Chrysophaeum taylorii]